MSARPLLNPRFNGLQCLRCSAVHPLSVGIEGCPDCAAAGYPASLCLLYKAFPATFSATGGHGCRRYSDWLAYADWPSLGEGGTPLIDLPRLSDELCLGSISVKYEGANPTGSHKDRMSMLVLAQALDLGASTVIAASSGNAGVSVAAYAARAGLDCVIVTMPGISPNWRRAIEMHGAKLVATADSLSRWPYVQRMVRERGWYPVTNYLNPPVGSAPVGVDGYRTIAFELAESPGVDAIDHVVVPTARADLLWGIARGFRDLEAAGITTRSPQVHAVEPFERLVKVIGGADYRSEFAGATAQSSTAGGTVTFQALDALRLCAGTAVAVDDSAAHADQRALGGCGVHLELSSAAGLSGARSLLEQGVIRQGERVVLIGTSHGFKEFEPNAAPIETVS